MVEDDGDIVGLIAYALFKQSVREAVSQGQMSALSRNPPASVVKTYRLSAERMLEEFATSIADDQRAEILESATIQAMNAASRDIKGHMSARTGFGQALLTNVIAWMITLAITVSIIWLSGRADPEDVIVDTAKRAEEARSAVRSLQAPGQQ